MEQYCIYLRKSRADGEALRQSEEDVLARHEAALRELAGRMDLTVARVFREVVSGDTIAARPVMQQLLAQVEQGRWAGVLVMEIERLARGDTIDQGLVAQAFRYSGTRIITPLKTFDPDNEFDEEYFEFGLFMSRREYKAINRRLQRGRLASAREGKFAGSRPPYGYRKEKLDGAKGYTLAPLAEEAGVVRLIYHWYADGGGGRTGYAAIARRLDGMGIPSPGGGRWSPSTVRDLLSNPVYAGKIRWNRRPVEKGLAGGRRVQTRPRREDCLIRDGLHPAIVEPALWERAQRIHASSPRRPDAGKRPLQNPLAGLVFCGVCGGRMTRKPGRNGEASLLCPTPGCANVSAPLPWVERELVAALNQLLGPLPLCLPDGAGAGQEARQASLSGLRTRLDQAERQAGSLHDLLEQGVYDAAQFRQRSRALRERAEALRESIRELERPEVAARVPALPAALSLEELYRRAGTPKEQNALLGALLERAVYTRLEGGRWRRAGFQLALFPRIGPRQGE